jgi:hypothetical protein
MGDVIFNGQIEGFEVLLAHSISCVYFRGPSIPMVLADGQPSSS